MPSPHSLRSQKPAKSKQLLRIVQACDKCRRRKIRCEGLSGGCEHCSHAGLECRTSKKLTRRVSSHLNTNLPRGPERIWVSKESLEESTFQIDAVSFSRNKAGTSTQHGSTPATGTDVGISDYEAEVNSEALPHISKVAKGWLGNISDNHIALDYIVPHTSEESSISSTLCETPLPVTFYDACIRTWFTTWHTLFPILNQEDLLDARERSTVNSGNGGRHIDCAQLHLIANITRSSLGPSAPQLLFCEKMWRGALDEMMMDTTMDVLHCIMLALLYSLLRGDRDKCQCYKGIAIGKLYRLGLHLELAPPFSSLMVVERRRRTFAVFHCLDSFSAAATGLPRLLIDRPRSLYNQPAAEDPPREGLQASKRDDGYASKDALIFYYSSKMLARVIKILYSDTTEQKTPPYQVMVELENQLNDWRTQMLEPLGSWLTRVVLGLVYHYIRLFIYFPVLSAHGDYECLPALAVLETSSRHIHQALEFLDTVDIQFPFFLDRNHLVALYTCVQKHTAIKDGGYHKPWPITTPYVNEGSNAMDQPEYDLSTLENTEDESTVQGSPQRYQESDWDIFVGALDMGRSNIHERIYGGEWMGSER